MQRTAFILVLFFQSSYGFAQSTVKDSAIRVPLFMASYALQLPGADMANRFGINSNVGGDFLYKFKNNWVLGANGSFLFGANVKEEHLFDSIKTQQGYVINQDGTYANLLLYERGFNAGLRFGKIVPLFGSNKNSGFLLTTGVGLLQHKIRIETEGNQAPQLDADYRKGYDRLTNGLSLTEFVGYIYLDNNRLLNFFLGFEFTQAFTQNRRSYNFDTMQRDSKQRFDVLNGFRVGLILPIYRRKAEGYYYY